MTSLPRSLTSSVGVVLDACVLVPAATRDTLLRAAEAELYRPLWSEEILDELERTILRLFQSRNESDAARRAQHLLHEIRAHFPEAIVSGYEHLIPAMTNDPKDRHVVAAAVAAGAQLIVTENLRDFPDEALAPHRLEVVRADAFLLGLFDLDPELLCLVIEEQGGDRTPPRSLDEQLQYLSRQLPGLASAVRAYTANPQ